VFFGVASIFIGGLFNVPLSFFGVASFSSKDFLMSPFAFFGVASFFIEGLFDEPMNEGSDSAPLFMAPCVCEKALVECQANLLSYFDPTLT
jgi:uncharacterized membrane-anchored protein YitT (DUF2179 family)